MFRLNTKIYNFMRHPILAGLLFLSLVLLVWQLWGTGSAGGALKLEFPENTMKAPEFPSGMQWLNTDRPLKLADLRGKVVLLDFWTYCCINCMHIIPDLKRLEAEFPNELVVIGVHSAKFAQEGETANIRQAILRYEIKHPVVNDKNFVVWQSYAARAWPTVVLIDPEGRIAQTEAGEGTYGQFRDSIQRLIEIYDAKQMLNRTPLSLKTEGETAPEGYLSYPGKVLAAVIPTKAGIQANDNNEDSLLDSRLRGNDNAVLFISDQNHNRIVITNPDKGGVLAIIGSGEIGFKDGSFEDASFNHPQGMALVGSKLYIADTENHSVREADFETRQVTTLAGNGKLSSGWGGSSGYGTKIALSSPWDLAVRDSLLYVAMAGTHQIWTIRLTDGYAAPFAGSAREGLLDGIRQRASLAQPSGLALLGDRLYFADSEVSAIRYVELDAPEGRVGTIVGLDLFEFGDKDGVGDAVRLQHPLGVATDGKLLYVADTYNSKIKVIDPQTRTAKTFFGSKAGLQDGEGKGAQFYEPGGLCFHNGKLYIADTNNGRIRVADLATMKVTTLDTDADVDAEKGGNVEVGVGEGSILARFTLPEGMKLNLEAQVVLTLVDGGGVATAKEGASVAYTPGKYKTTYELPVTWREGSGDVVIEVNFVYCGEQNPTACYPGHKKLVLKVKVVPGGSADAKVEVDMR